YYTPSGVSIQSEGIKPDIEIEDVNSEIFAKAINKSNSLRERDMAGHLKGEKEKLADKNASKNVNQDLQNNSAAWWNDIGSKKDSELTEKERLFKTDYQAYQAYSYLKAWRTLKSMAK
ncbi:MAG: S41 family peptidase, partial [Pseudobdellovibrio sp.]